MTSLFLKSGRSSVAALRLAARLDCALLDAEAPAVRLHLVTVSGRGQWTRANRRIHWRSMELLVSAGIDFTTGNDAPRGGAVGTYIELTRAEAQRFVDMIRAADGA